MPEAALNLTMADPYFGPADRARFHKGAEAVLSGALSMGPNVAAFEREFAKRMGVRHAVATSSCTAALEIALAALGLEPGDEVIVPCLTFVATGMAVHNSGGKPVFAEVSETTLALDVDDVRARITPRTRGVIVVHMTGLLGPDTPRLRALCDRKGLFLLEDAAHAPGAVLGGKAAGSIGHAGCFSFFPTKVMTAGEGGMFVTGDEGLARTARSLQHRGRDLSAASETYSRAGRNVRMTEMAALLGRIQLARLSGFLAGRRRVAKVYDKALGADRRLTPIRPTKARASTYWKYPLLLPQGRDRQALSAALRARGMATDGGYSPLLHLQPAFRSLLGTREGQLPKSEKALQRLLCLPCHPRVTNDQARRAASALRQELDRS